MSRISHGPVVETGAWWRRACVVVAIVLSAFAFNTAENLPIGLLDMIATDLDASLPRTGLLVSGYGLVVAVVSLPLARIKRRLPRRPLVTVVLAVLAICSIMPTYLDSFGSVLATRLATACAQALFWAVMGLVAVGMFDTRYRGRIIGLLSVGGALATIAGVPAGNWIAHRNEWQTPFIVVSVLAVLASVTIGALLPTMPAESTHAAYGARPDRRRFAAVLAVTGLSVSGTFCTFTYIVDFLLAVSGISGASVSGMLGLFGIGGFAGVMLVGPLLDRYPASTLLLPVLLQAAIMLLLYIAGHHRPVTLSGVPVFGAAAAPAFMVTRAG
ncbi:MFS transporter [Georgenia deserti]|uniref:MFS transporter n=1 Tax=Georgenia deserti TaxID=2093781 RepID=A0ABW4L2S6_9MICO